MSTIPAGNKNQIAVNFTEEIWDRGNLKIADEIFSKDFIDHDPVTCPGFRGLHNSFLRNSAPQFLSIKSSVSLLLTIVFFYTSLSSFGQDVLTGLTSNGGTDGGGTIFNIKSTGTNFTLVKSFPDWGKNQTGSFVQGPDGNYYGMSQLGGAFTFGTIFRMTSTGAITVLHHFDYAKEGGNPMGSLTLGADGSFYGLTSEGGINTYGTIFKITTAGVYTVLHNFTYAEGVNPRGHMVIGTDGNFYGLTYQGGVPGYGTIFKYSTAGVFTVLKSFATATDGSHALGSLVRRSDGNFYGGTSSGGSHGNGTIFKITPAGVFSLLWNMNGPTDGYSLKGDLVQAPDNFLYGMAYAGGSLSAGTIFKISTSGAFTVIHKFSSTTEGYDPVGSLFVSSDGYLYGLTNLGGAHGNGTVFKTTTAGVLTLLHSFTLATEGGNPNGSLIKGTDGNYYGLTPQGGVSLFGSAFKISGTGTFTVLNSFNGGIQGNAPNESLIQAFDNSFYGTTSTGGVYNYGTIFKICGGVSTVVHSFNRNTEGAYPKGSLIQARDSNFYGMTSTGGLYGGGTLFKITRTGVFTIMHNFNSTPDGSSPLGSLIQAPNGLLYGMTSTGGSGVGTIFQITTSGTYTVLHVFTSATDGGNPEGNLITGTDGNLYGMTKINTRIFKITSTGAFTVLKTLTYATEGGQALGSLVLGSDGNYYGTTSIGGSFGYGTIFKMTPAGIVAVMKHLNLVPDGGIPAGNLVIAADGNFYGMNSKGGPNGSGVIFRISPIGTYGIVRFLNLLTDGGTPLGSLLVQKPNLLIANAQNDTTNEDVSKAIVLKGSGGAPLTFVITTNPKNGTLSGSGANRSYKGNLNYNGRDSFYFTSNAGCLNSAPAKVYIVINPVNDTPVLANIGNRTIKVNTLYNFTATATDVDAGQTKTFSLISAPLGAGINAGTGVFSWTPSVNGSYTFKVRVTDNGTPVLFDEEQITITVNSTGSATIVSLWKENGEQIQELSTLYPNPAHNKITITSNAFFQKQSVIITNMNGAVMQHWASRKAGEGKAEFNIDKLAVGAYLLKIQTGKGVMVYRFVKL